MSLIAGGSGRLGATPKLKKSRAGNPWCRVNVATDTWNGEERVTTWVQLSIFGNDAKYICEHGKKGDSISFHGDIWLAEWENEDGETVRTLSGRAVQGTITLFYSKKRIENEAKKKAYQKPDEASNEEEESGSSPYNDDIPF